MKTEKSDFHNWLADRLMKDISTKYTAMEMVAIVDEYNNIGKIPVSFGGDGREVDSTQTKGESKSCWLSSKGGGEAYFEATNSNPVVGREITKKEYLYNLHESFETQEQELSKPKKGELDTNDMEFFNLYAKKFGIVNKFKIGDEVKVYGKKNSVKISRMKLTSDNDILYGFMGGDGGMWYASKDVIEFAF